MPNMHNFNKWELNSKMTETALTKVWLKKLTNVRSILHICRPKRSQMLSIGKMKSMERSTRIQLWLMERLKSWDVKKRNMTSITEQDAVLSLLNSITRKVKLKHRLLERGKSLIDRECYLLTNRDRWNNNYLLNWPSKKTQWALTALPTKPMWHSRLKLIGRERLFKTCFCRSLVLEKNSKSRSPILSKEESNMKVNAK